MVALPLCRGLHTDSAMDPGWTLPASYQYHWAPRTCSPGRRQCSVTAPAAPTHTASACLPLCATSPAHLPVVSCDSQPCTPAHCHTCSRMLQPPVSLLNLSWPSLSGGTVSSGGGTRSLSRLIGRTVPLRRIVPALGELDGRVGAAYGPVTGCPTQVNWYCHSIGRLTRIEGRPSDSGALQVSRC